MYLRPGFVNSDEPRPNGVGYEDGADGDYPQRFGDGHAHETKV